MANTVMVIDDSADFRALCSQVIRMEEGEPITFENGLEALEYLREAKSLPKIIFVDLMMPEFSGKDFVEAIRSESKLSALNVVVVSGRDDLRDQARKIGANGILRKPFELDQFRQLVRAAF